MIHPVSLVLADNDVQLATTTIRTAHKMLGHAPCSCCLLADDNDEQAEGRMLADTQTHDTTATKTGAKAALHDKC